MEQKQDKPEYIYIVTEGEYSAYHIVAAFDRNEKAEDFVKTHVPYGQIERFEVNPYERERREGQLVYEVQMERDGTVVSVAEDNSSEGFESAILGEALIVRRRNIITRIDRLILIATCFAKDQQHAVKIANERRIQLIADGTWKLSE